MHQAKGFPRCAIWGACLLALAISACQSALELPSDQEAFILEWHELKEEHARAERTGNALQKSAVADRARALFGSDRDALAWRGTVRSVESILGKTWVNVSAGGMLFRVYPRTDSGRDLLPLLARGDTVQFSGTVSVEVSLTISGAINHPDLYVSAIYLDRYWGQTADS